MTNRPQHALKRSKTGTKRTMRFTLKDLPAGSEAAEFIKHVHQPSQHVSSPLCIVSRDTGGTRR
ncbi:hypothetical protein GCM10011408_40330 [Dyella caseinilytica]|nr:hypothetical protein GCM10011408_40330 [Dyella caseinilytica]